MSRNTYDVIVLGVGGMGSAACYHLAKQRIKVLGIEQFQVGHDHGSSHGETRIIRRAYFEHSDYIPLLNRAYELWDELEKESKQKLFVKNGVVIYGDPATSVVYQGTLSSAQKYQIPIETLTNKEALKRFPVYHPTKELEAIFEPGAGFLHVEDSVQAHAMMAAKYGATILENETVLSTQTTANETSVTTNRGTYVAKKLVVTSGAWTGKILNDLGLPITLHRLIQYWYRASSDYQQNAPCFAFHMEGNFFYGFPMLDGKTVKIASHFSRDSIQNPEEKNITTPPAEQLKLLQNFIQKCMPKVSLQLERFVSCIYSMTPDENFIVDVHPNHGNVVIAAGFSGHGFKFSSVIGEILKDLSLTGKSKLPIDFLRVKRFRKP